MHFCPAFEVSSVTELLHVRVELRGPRPRHPAPRIEALIESVSLVNRTPPVCTLSCARSLSAVDALPVKPDEVAESQVIEQGRHAAAHELQRPLGQQPRLDEDAHARLGDVAGRGRGLDERRHSREERGRELLERAPHREVEGVDLHRHAGQAGVDMPPEE